MSEAENQCLLCNIIKLIPLTQLLGATWKRPYTISFGVIVLNQISNTESSAFRQYLSSHMLNGRRAVFALNILVQYTINLIIKTHTF